MILFLNWVDINFVTPAAVVFGMAEATVPLESRSLVARYECDHFMGICMAFKHLPHLDFPEHYQFITFRTFDSVDHFVQKLAMESMANDKKQLVIDKYLDVSDQGAYLNGIVLHALGDFLRAKDGVLYDLVAFCIMPNHVHLLFKAKDSLALVMQKLKGGSAKMINELLEREGRFWARDYYDRVIRDDRHFEQVYQYIANNPLKLFNAQDVDLRFYGVYE